jgi:pimeloyl-ACP methyl ester carboxylesterase
MTTFKLKDVNDLYARVLALYFAEDYTGAFELATAGLEQFPQNRNFVQSLRAMLAARVGEEDTALTILRETIEKAGFWFGSRFWQDEDFDAIRENAEFVRLHAISDERMKAAQASVKPELTTFEPPDTRQAPLLMALHGNGSSVFWHTNHWQPAAAQGWLVALPQSSQLAGHDTIDQYAYSWDHEPTVDREIRDHYAALHGRFAEDRVVVAGFSRGAENAVRLALQGVIPARGFIAVCPGGPYSQEPELWDAVIKAGHSVRGWIIMGGKDHFGEETNVLVDKLRAAGSVVEVSVYDDMGHDYPPDFQDRLPEMLRFVLG